MDAKRDYKAERKQRDAARAKMGGGLKTSAPLVKIKTYKCKHCKSDYQRRTDDLITRWCSYDCAVELAKKASAKKKLEQKKKERIDIGKRKLDIKPLSYFEKKLQGLVNEIARLIDFGHPCISCQRFTGKDQGGHYHTRGGNKSLAYNFHNVFLQCYKCNVIDSANIIGYDEGLIAGFGKGYWEYVKFSLVRLYPVLKPSRSDLIEWASKARVIRNRLKKNPVKLGFEQRKLMREELNELLGIYKQ